MDRRPRWRGRDKREQRGGDGQDKPPDAPGAPPPCALACRGFSDRPTIGTLAGAIRDLRPGKNRREVDPIPGLLGRRSARLRRIGVISRGHGPDPGCFEATRSARSTRSFIAMEAVMPVSPRRWEPMIVASNDVDKRAEVGRNDPPSPGKCPRHGAGRKGRLRRRSAMAAPPLPPSPRRGERPVRGGRGRSGHDPHSAAYGRYADATGRSVHAPQVRAGLAALCRSVG